MNKSIPFYACLSFFDAEIDKYQFLFESFGIDIAAGIVTPLSLVQ